MRGNLGHRDCCAHKVCREAEVECYCVFTILEIITLKGTIINLLTPDLNPPPRSATVPRFLERGFNFQCLLLEKKLYLIDFSSKCKEIKFRSVFMN
jgi:hypothetical protein